MDVELLRPGNVPISPNTVLWFEFLLNPNLLEEHLRKPNPDPVPSDLLVKFLALSVEPSPEDSFEKSQNFKCSKRQLSMKILALKIVAFWNWDLEIIESKLPLQLQYVLLRDLLCLVSNDADQNFLSPALHHNLNIDQLRDEQLFAISLYHRWTLHIIVNSPMVSKNILFCTTSSVESADEIMSKIMDDEGKSELILKKILSLTKDSFVCPTFHSLSPPLEELDLEQDWNNGIKISAARFFYMIYYDLGTYKVYRELNNEATEYFTSCKQLYDQLSRSKANSDADNFFRVKEECLKGFCYACGISVNETRNLTLQFYSAIRNNYSVLPWWIYTNVGDVSLTWLQEHPQMFLNQVYTKNPIQIGYRMSATFVSNNIINVLQADNLKREIPLSHRDSLELDLPGTLATGKFTASRDLLFQIQTLNIVRRVMEAVSYPSVVDYTVKLNASRKGNTILIKALKAVINEATDEERLKIRFFLLNLFDKCDSTVVQSVKADSELSSLFSEAELRESRTGFDDDDTNVPDVVEFEQTQSKKMKLMGSGQLELSLLENQIIRLYDPPKVRELVIKFTSINSERVITTIYNKWEKYFQCELKDREKNFQASKNKDIDRHIQCDKYHVMGEMIPRIPNRNIQQFCYTALSKVKELLELQKYDLAQKFIAAATEDLKKHPFTQLLSWESLYVTIVEKLDVWPSNTDDWKTLANSCKDCITMILYRYSDSYRGSMTGIPREQIGEQCAIILLHIDRDWLASFNFVRQLRYLKLFSALAVACKMPCQDPWNLIVPTFSTSNLQKKQSVQFIDRDGITYLSKMALTRFLVRFRDSKVINVVLSLLSRLHNVIRDEPNLELSCILAQVWPSSVPNSSAYNPDAVVDVISDVLDAILKYQPCNCDWLKLAGDVNFVKEHYSAALKRYFEALVAQTDYFLRLSPKNAGDDFIYKRMIRCCSMLQCYTQAAVMCQFLDEVDYTTAFKCLSETITADATDCYYDCIWDVNILEYLISLHTKRNEHDKKQKVIDAMGLLELNSNNNEEIKREASNVRKVKFLRAMAKQYIIY